MYKVFFVVVALIATVNCLPAVNDDEPVDRPGYCRIGNVYIKEGERGPGPIGECTINTCYSAKTGAMMIFSLTCPEFVPRPQCHKSELDYTKQYPDCCPDEVCPPGFE